MVTNRCPKRKSKRPSSVVCRSQILPKGIETTKFIASYLQKLLGGYKEGEIKQDVHKSWQETLLSLEEKGRKVVSAGEDKLTLSVFCPTLESWKQLHDGIWTEEVTDKMRKLIESLGMLLYFSTVAVEFPLRWKV